MLSEGVWFRCVWTSPQHFFLVPIWSLEREAAEGKRLMLTCVFSQWVGNNSDLDLVPRPLGADVPAQAASNLAAGLCIAMKW